VPKADSCVDEIAENDLLGFDITGKKVFNALAQKRLTKTGIALNACPDRFLAISRQRHYLFLRGTGAVVVGLTS
jgi:hypothetical protein